jgi:hypothetical protein
MQQPDRGTIRAQVTALIVMIGKGFVKLTAECALNLLICAAVVRRFAGSPIQGRIVRALRRADLGATA